MSCIGSPLVTRRIEIVSAAQHPQKPESITRNLPSLLRKSPSISHVECSKAEAPDSPRHTEQQLQDIASHIMR